MLKICQLLVANILFYVFVYDSDKFFFTNDGTMKFLAGNIIDYNIIGYFMVYKCWYQKTGRECLFIRCHWKDFGF